MVTYSSSYRGAYLASHNEGDPMFAFCAEPVPDTAIEEALTAALEVEAKKTKVNTNVDYSTTIQQLAEKRQAILFLRDARFGLCELFVNNMSLPAGKRISDDEFVELYHKMFQVALEMLKVEFQAQITAQKAEDAKMVIEAEITKQKAEEVKKIDKWKEMFEAAEAAGVDSKKIGEIMDGAFTEDP